MIILKPIFRAMMALVMMFPVGAMAQQQWCALTDNSHLVTLSNISYLVSSVGQTKFNIVLNDGRVIEDVESMTFARFHIDGIEDARIGTNTVLSLTSDKILVSNAPLGAALTITTLEGRRILSSIIDSDEQQVDISSLTPAVYILSVGGKTVKFRKL